MGCGREGGMGDFWVRDRCIGFFYMARDLSGTTRDDDSPSMYSWKRGI